MLHLKERNLTPGRCARRLRSTLDLYHAPHYIGAVECALIAQQLHSAGWIIHRHPQYTVDERRLFAEVAGLSYQACQEPFEPFPRRIGEALIQASADACRVLQDRVFNRQPLKDLSYFYTLYFWISALIENGAVTLHPNTAFDAAWDMVRAWMLGDKREELLPEIERSCRKRADKFAAVLAEYGLFVLPEERDGLAV